MSRIVFSNGQTVNFSGSPTQADIEEISSQMQGGVAQPQPQQAPQPNPFGATFRDAGAGNETGLSGGLKSFGNLPSSALNLAKGVASIVANPIDTAKGIGSFVTDIGRKGTNAFTGITGIGKKQATPTLSSLGSVFNDRFGTSFGDKKFTLDDMLSRLQTTAIEDPVGFGADIAGILTGGAATIGRTKQLGEVASKVAQVATAPIRVPVRVATKGVSEVTKFGVSQATGLTPDTLKTVMTQPKAFGEARAAGVSRTDLATDVFAAINKASDELGDLGKGYDTIRKSDGVVSLPDNWLAPSIEKFGLKLRQQGGAGPKMVNGQIDLNAPIRMEVFADRGSQTRNVADINKIQNFVDSWGDSKTFTRNEYLNMRSDLAEIAKFDQAGSNVSRSFATNLREGTLNSDAVRTQVTGLKELDSKFSKDITFFKKLKKEFLDGQGNLKDGAASKVVNAVNTANPQRLARLEKLYPGFTKQAQVIKAVEDVEAAMGLKVGAYMRAGTAVAGFATGNLGLIISAILATPEIAIPLLKAMGLTGQKAAPVLKAIRDFSSDINNFRAPGAVSAYMEKNYKDGVPVGMSIKSTVTPEQKLKIAKEIEQYDSTPIKVNNQVDLSNADTELRLDALKEKNAKGSFTDTDAIEAQKLLDKMGIKINMKTSD